MLHFAVAGAPLSTPKPGGTVKGLERAAALGITAMEVEWVQSVPTSVERMEEIRAVATKHKVALTVHAPYYINLNSLDPAKLTASKKRIIDALAMSELCGARSVCVHPAFYGGMDHDEVYDRVRDATESMLKHKDKLFPHVNLAYETMGKPSQFGTLDEVLKLSAEFGLYPCLDPAHMHARTNGEYNSAKEWNEMFDLYEHYLGKPALKNVHMHFLRDRLRRKRGTTPSAPPGERCELEGIPAGAQRPKDRGQSRLRIAFIGEGYVAPEGDV